MRKCLELKGNKEFFILESNMTDNVIAFPGKTNRNAHSAQIGASVGHLTRIQLSEKDESMEILHTPGRRYYRSLCDPPPQKYNSNSAIAQISDLGHLTNKVMTW